MVRLGWEMVIFSGVIGRCVTGDGGGMEVIEGGPIQGRDWGRRDILSNCFTRDMTVLPEAGLGRVGPEAGLGRMGL